MKSKLPSKLIVAVLQMVHVMELNKTGDNRYEITGGVEGLFLRDALEQLGIQYEVVMPPDGEYGRRKKNGSWSGLVGMAESGRADLACNGLAILDERRKAVEFSTPYAISVQTFAIKKAQKYHLKNAYMYPFRLSVWVCFFGALIVTTAALWIVVERKYSAGRIVFELCRSAVRQPLMLKGRSWQSKFLVSLCCGYALVLTSSYSGVLLSFMTVPLEGETVETIRQLSEAITRGTHRCYVVQGTITVVYLLFSGDPYLTNLGRSIKQNKWYLKSFDSESLANIGPNDAIISSKIFLDIFYHGTSERKSNYLVSNDPMSTSLLGIAFNRNFCCRKKLNRAIRRLEEIGMREKYSNEAAFKFALTAHKMEKKAEGKEYTISFEDISGALIILVIGYAISFATLIAEILFSKYLEKRH